MSPAACFENRVAAIVCADGIYDPRESFTNIVPASIHALIDVRKDGEPNAQINENDEEGDESAMGHRPRIYLVWF